MIKPPKSPDEAQRLAALQEYQILDTPPELAYDDITFLASKICGTPIAAISLVDRNRQWFKSKIGLDAEETSRDIAFCAHAILDKTQPLVVEDARRDERFVDNPLVTGDLSIRFYAGNPLITSEGHALGTLCVIDQQPRQLTDDERHALAILSREVVSQLELRRALRELDRTRVQQLELKDRFLSHVSHELRSPLTVIFQFVTILLDGIAGKLTSEQKEYLEIIDRNAKQLRMMIGDLVEVTRAKTGKVSLERDALSIKPVLTEVIQSLQVSAAEKNVELSSIIDSKLPLVHADLNRVRQILVNLVENALKFTPDGGTISVNATTCPDTSDMVQVSVADSGCGIASDECDRIFEQLYQVQDQRPEARKGLGLGLFISNDLVSRHGGRMWVESEPGHGTTFYFTLPAISLMDCVYEFLSMRDINAGPLSLVSIELSQPGAAHDIPTGDDVAEWAWAELCECLTDEHLILPAGDWTDSRQAVFVLVADAPEKAAQLSSDILNWLNAAKIRAGHDLQIEAATQTIPFRIEKNADLRDTIASAVVRTIDDLVLGSESRGAA